ncbi:MAG: hypothetical protein R2762_10345 [Bryobacteraceae bacterium]
MRTTLEKLRPDTDLQVYFERPSAIAALSEASATGFTLSGTWRQQFDWAVVEWNQHNTFEHPAFRTLPDGNLSGLTLTYDEERTNCIALDSDLFATVSWPDLRIWTRENGVDDFYTIELADHATPIEGDYVAAWAEMELQGTVTAGDYVGISYYEEHHTYQALAGDTLEDILDEIAISVNASTTLSATRIGTKIRLTVAGGVLGANGNRLGIYGFVSGTGTENWAQWSMPFSGGESPAKWRISIDFGNLVASDERIVPTGSIRKMRWTYAADMQPTSYQRSEFSVKVTNWTVTGTGRTYSVAAATSRRIEDDSPEVAYTGTWTSGIGNFSGGTIHQTTVPGSAVSIDYFCPGGHQLYLGTRYAFSGAVAEVHVDGVLLKTETLLIPGEDVLARLHLGSQSGGSHNVTVTHSGAANTFLYFDFLEIATPTTALPVFPADDTVTLATDWDTDHSIALPAERTAWMMESLGFRGRANHYVGALWFYELSAPAHVYASATVEFTGVPSFSATTTMTIGRVGETETALITHLNRIGDTAVTIAKAFEIYLNRGYTAIWAEAQGPLLTIYSRAMGPAGNDITVAATPASGSFSAVLSGPQLSGASEQVRWLTDLTASPRVNRAARDWSRAFYVELKNYGIDVTAAFSLELQHGDDSEAAGIAQRYPDGTATWLNTPALQTNFSPESLAYWREVHRDMATVMVEAGVEPYLQFGEVQWWYFPKDGVGMPLYDAYTTSQFMAAYSRPMAVIPSDQADPALYTDELVFLPQLIGAFTNQVISFVRASHPTCRFEVLYPTDVNNTPLNQLLNYPGADWTPAVLDNMKTESFTFTFTRNLDLAKMTVDYGDTRGFSRDKRSFLVGIGDSSSPWRKEVEMAKGEGVESIVLFALDQYCLIGYETPMRPGLRRSTLAG